MSYCVSTAASPQPGNAEDSIKLTADVRAVVGIFILVRGGGGGHLSMQVMSGVLNKETHSDCDSEMRRRAGRAHALGSTIVFYLIIQSYGRELYTENAMSGL